MNEDVSMNKARVKEWVMQNRRSRNILLRATAALLYLLLDIFMFMIRICPDPMFRAVSVMRIFNGGSVHQTTPLTFSNRFPGVFSECARYFGDKAYLRTLSFGCSTGEEVLTLREYFPTAEIIGAELNKRSLRICDKLEVDGKISFVYSMPKRLKRLGAFDAIFCMAVFQRTPHLIAEAGIQDISRIYPFRKFEDQLILFRDLVKKGGIIVIHFAQYSLEDTCVAPDFIAFGDCTQAEYGLPVFNRNGIRLESTAPWHSIYVKK